MIALFSRISRYNYVFTWVQYAVPESGSGRAAHGQWPFRTDELRVSAKRTFSLDARQAHDPWATLWNVNVALTDQWQHFSYAISTSASEDNGRITFSNLGAATGTIELSGVSLKPGGGFKLKPGEGLVLLRRFLLLGPFGPASRCIKRRFGGPESPSNRQNRPRNPPELRTGVVILVRLVKVRLSTLPFRR